MKLRVRVNKHTYRVELAEEGGAHGASLTELSVRIREVLLPSQGLR